MVSAEGRRAPGGLFSQPLLSLTALEPRGRSRGPVARFRFRPAGLGLRGAGQAREGRRRADPSRGGRWLLAAAVAPKRAAAPRGSLNAVGPRPAAPWARVPGLSVGLGRGRAECPGLGGGIGTRRELAVLRASHLYAW